MKLEQEVAKLSDSIRRTILQNAVSVVLTAGCLPAIKYIAFNMAACRASLRLSQQHPLIWMSGVLPTLVQAARI